ncbi:hypothetical protein [Ignavibacterium album]|uniref:hypothetical protein n=1 Tax=Ignavibacterium album TaxID=591197 RepID=UPI0035BB4EF6
MKIFLLTGLSLSIIEVLFLLSSGRTEFLNNTDSSFINFDTLKVLKELALSREDSVLLNIEELKKLDSSVCREFLFYDSIFNNLYYLFHIYMTVYSNPDGITQYGSARIIYKKNNPTEQIFKLSIDSLKILRGTLDGIVPAYEIIDINYDGYKDLHLYFTENATGRVGNNIFFLFNPLDSRFIFDSTMNNQFMYKNKGVDTSLRSISAGGRLGQFEFVGSYYVWNGKEYIEKYKYELFDSPDTIFILKKEFRNGEWKIIETDSITY